MHCRGAIKRITKFGDIVVNAVNTRWINLPVTSLLASRNHGLRPIQYITLPPHSNRLVSDIISLDLLVLS